MARSRNFTRAAEEMNLSQPALSRLIRQLEQRTGTRLLDRDTRNVRLTIAGEQFLPAASNIVTALQLSLADLKDLGKLQHGSLSIAVIPSVASRLLPMAIARFRQTHPNIRFSVKEVLTDPLIEAVRLGHCELGIGALLGELDDLRFTQLVEDSLVLVSPIAHPLGQRGWVNWSALEGIPLILPQEKTGLRRLIEWACAKANVRLREEFTYQTMGTVIGFVTAGVACGILPSGAALSGRAHSMAEVRIEGPKATRRIGIVTRKGLSLSPSAERFSEMLVSMTTATVGSNGSFFQITS